MRRLLLAAALLATACTTQADFVSGVEGGTKLDEVTTAEAMQFCTALDRYLQDSFDAEVEGRFNCSVAALQTQFTPDTCQASVDACLPMPPTTPLNIMPIDCTFAGPEPTCHATINELEHCLAAEVATYLEYLDSANCSIAGNSTELNRLSNEPLTPEECTRLRGTCPVYAGGFFD
ncbi:MAG: hypothetical protein H6719_25415 [Sandaracinaceae bacterium]|nr:hypothetical protein [Sandaracinaceae bacterium]